jgi:hypothetical protein
MSVRARLLLGFLVVTAALVAPTLFATSSLSHLRRLAVEERSGHTAAVARLGRIQQGLSELDRLERSFIATGDRSLGRAAAAQVASLHEDLHALRSSTSPALPARLEAAIDHVSALTRLVEGYVQADRKDRATETFSSLLVAFDDASAELAVVADSIDAMALRDVQDAESTSATARAVTLTGLAVALLFALAVAGYTTQVERLRVRRGRQPEVGEDGGLESDDGATVLDRERHVVGERWVDHPVSVARAPARHARTS